MKRIGQLYVVKTIVVKYFFLFEKVKRKIASDIEYINMVIKNRPNSWAPGA